MTLSGGSGPVEPVTVLESFPVPRPTTNPYITMLGRSLESTAGVTLVTFSWRAALLGRYDVFHVHWPEILVSGRDPLRRAIRRAQFAAFLARLWFTRTPVVRTVHNLGQHEDASRIDAWLLRRLERLTTVRIAINDSTPMPAGATSAVIPHGHYRDWYGTSSPLSVTPGAIAFFGLIRPYKGVAALIAAVLDIPAESAITLHVAGRASPPQLGDELVALAGEDSRIFVSLDFLSDDDLVEHVERSELVVLPYLEMLNSGGALTALSLDRPILVPANAVTDALAEEVGAAWVQRFDGPLSAEHILHALAAVRVAGRGSPDLSRRQWDLAGRQHLEAFRLAIAERRGGSA